MNDIDTYIKDFKNITGVLDSIRKRKGSTSAESVFAQIKAVMENEFPDFTMTVFNGDNDCYFLYVDGLIVALADLIEIDEYKVLSISFHVGCLSNTAIRIHSLLNRYLTITIIANNVMYPLVDKKGRVSILYNDKANAKYLDNMYHVMIKKKKDLDEAMSEAGYRDDTEFH